MAVSTSWSAPYHPGPVDGTVTVPGSKSMTNRALVIAAGATSPSVIHGALASRDSELMEGALRVLGTRVDVDGSTITVTPGPVTAGIIDCGLAGTVMRFVPPVAALGASPTLVDGDVAARRRPMATMAEALTQLGARVEGDTLPMTITGPILGGEARIDASASSQFVSGLLLTGARFPEGVTVTHVGERVPSLPHIEMTLAMLKQWGVESSSTRDEEAGNFSWAVGHQDYPGTEVAIEPDLSNAAAFLAAAAVTGGRVSVPHWPSATTQPGDEIRHIFDAMGCTHELAHGTLTVTGPEGGALHGIDIDMSAVGELTPTVAAVCALAGSPSRLTGVAHLRGHETDRLQALTTELTNVGCGCEELADGLAITPAPMTGGVWRSYEDHRMATAGAIIGLRVPGVYVENIETTAKTLPGFARMWEALLGA
ncbi:3-phosphoshikimate 1-carboxyvinyltransferase [Corynebacterium pyruviciproducens]|uniref:3-phosphoshikimate 1-carboxyvinyltransferase n=1 Tax=Corynebacterium pyruviciproducens ATCC BAA-1742 TaxID=1125779 RepID=S2Z042_9CORY|nr:3-phosphoshikimate 1-carboxyvinyltransferase [Corynebacterium pyruviciproducens ATCC BAA-1742]